MQYYESLRDEFLGQIILSYFGIKKQKNIGPPW